MEKSFDEKASLCALNRIFGFEPKRGLKLLHDFGSGMAVFSATGKEIEESIGAFSNRKYSEQITPIAFDSAAMELEGLARRGCRFVGIGEDGYPPLLMECNDPPLGIYFRGVSDPKDVFCSKPSIAVVGTRNVSHYGKDWCRMIVEAMSKANAKPLIVSGLALGVDGIAHQTAMDTGLPTVAVMATGIDSIYPAQHGDLGEKMASTPGCALITDYPPESKAMPVNFIRRNRLIAGISKATILIESKIKGGGMITARLAASYDRDLYALPGRLDDPFSQGCNLLIHEKFAEPIGDISKLISDLGLGSTPLRRQADYSKAVREHYSKLISGDELEVICSVAECIKHDKGISMDEICQRKHLSFNTLSNCVTMLECDGFVTVDLLQHCYPKNQAI